MRKCLYIAFMIFLFFTGRGQHGAMYSQYMFNGLLINPAYAGSNEVLNITALNRNQWIGFDGSPRTSTISLHTPLKNRKVNLGLTFSNDQLGITTQNKVTAVYAYRLFFGNNSLSFGLQAGLNMKRNDWSRIVTTTGADQVFVGQTARQSIPESGFGIYFKNKRIFAGLSAPDLLTLKKVEGLHYKPFIFTSGVLLSLSENVKLKPSVALKYIRNSPLEMDFNANIYLRAAGLGFSYRTNDAMVFMATYAISKQFTAGYAYDLTISKLGTYVRGSHEIMLKYEFGYDVHPKSTRYF